MITVAAVLLLMACGTEKAQGNEVEPEGEVTANDIEMNETSQVASLVDVRLQEPTEDTVCEMCNMKDHEDGIFSAQAIKEDGLIAFYDDIGCLVNVEVANNESNEKFVRDFHTLDWAKVEEVTIVKTGLKSPMNWGYIYFIDKTDADQYIAENPNAYVEELQAIKDEALERRNKKMGQTTEQDANSDVMNMEDGHHEGDGHNH